MDLFPDGIHMRLRSRVRRRYLHADEDGEGVSLRRRDPTLNAVWRVHRVQLDGAVYMLLRGAAYGRYLALSEDARPGHRGVLVVQRDYDERNRHAVMWTPRAIPGGGGYVNLRHPHVCVGNLRANGRFRAWNNGVTLDRYEGERSTMRHWRVEVVQPRQGPPPSLPYPTPNPGGCIGLFQQRTKGEADRGRMIRYLRSDEPRNFGVADVSEFAFCGRSVLELRTMLGMLANQGDVNGTIMCVQAGLFGGLTPLVTDLPRSYEPMNIVVFTAGSPGAEELVYPDVDT